MDASLEAETSPNHLKRWAGAFAAFSPSRRAVRRNLTALVLLILVAFAGSFVLSMLQRGLSPARPTPSQIGFVFLMGLIFQVLSGFFGAFINGAQVKTYLSGVRGESIEFNEAARTGWAFIWKLFLLNLVIGISVLGGLMLLIVPGLIILARLALAPYFLIGQNLDFMDAYAASWKATKGHSWKVWGIIGVSGLMLVPIITIVGILATIYLEFMYAAAFAVLYQHLVSNDKQSIPSST